jgi:hypothetical protein
MRELREPDDIFLTYGIYSYNRLSVISWNGWWRRWQNQEMILMGEEVPLSLAP